VGGARAVSGPDLRQHYSSLSDEAILELAATDPDDFSPEARDILADELRGRQLLSPVGPVASSEGESAMCPKHPDAVAGDICARCGDFLCGDCVSVRSRAGAWCVDCSEHADLDHLHYVPVGRFLVLSVLTWGFYALYWNYRYWQSVKQIERSDIWPFVRAMFDGITFFWVIADINRRTHAYEGRVGPKVPQVLAVFNLLLGFMGNAPDPFWMLTLVAPFLAIPVLLRISEMTPDRVKAERDPLQPRHWIAGVCFGLLWLLAGLGSLLPEV
jgi:hypothetical protein